MHWKDIISGRRSIRQYVDAPVTDEQLYEVMEAARLAPSWKNKQGWEFIILRERAHILALKEATGGNPRGNAYEAAACFIIACADPEQAEVFEGKPYYMTDVTIALQQLMLSAYALGLGTCWVGAVREQPIRDLLGIPEHIRIVGLTPLGVPAETPDARPRKSMEQIVRCERWDGKRGL